MSLLVSLQVDADEEISGVVRRYAGLVYATARRIVGERELALDVMQTAFLVLARKFHRIDRRVLPGWLVNTTRLSARQALRGKWAREKHENLAAGLKRESDPGVEGIGELVPLLDEALGKLNEMDRTAVVLRFLEGESFARVAECIGSTEDTARKRVERAVEKLRGIFMERRVVPSVGGVMLMLVSQQSGRVLEGVRFEFMQRSTLNAQRSTLKGRTGARWMVSKAAVVVLAGGLGIVAAVHRGSAGDAPVATTEPSAVAKPAADFVARLANGTTVELFGVNENPDDGKVGWRVDGGELGERFDGVTNHFPPLDDSRDIEIGLRIVGKDRQGKVWNALNMKWKASEGALGLAGRMKGKVVVPNEFVLLGQVRADVEQMDVTVRLAMKAAQVVAKVQGNAAAAKNATDLAELGHFELSNPREVDGLAVVTAKIPTVPEGWQVVVRAVPRKTGYILATDGASAVGGTNGEARDISYNAKLAEVSEFRVELRDYTTAVEFQHVAIKPGVKTDFKIVTHEVVSGEGEKGL